MTDFTPRGSFKVESGAMRVTDPCYDTSVWCSGQLDNVRDGIWDAFVKESDESDWGVRNAELIVIHENAKLTPQDVSDKPGEAAEFEVGVDAGQAGFFDLKYYTETCDEGGRPIDDVPNHSGMGVSCSSGFGDGGYTCFTHRHMHNGEIIAAKIVFITDEKEE